MAYSSATVGHRTERLRAPPEPLWAVFGVRVHVHVHVQVHVHVHVQVHVHIHGHVHVHLHVHVLIGDYWAIRYYYDALVTNKLGTLRLALLVHQILL